MADGIQEIVRAGDKDLFLSTLFCPAERQADLFALWAFHTEISRIPLLVSEAQIGEIRLQWWADTVEAIARGESPDHPVAHALADVVQQHRLPTGPLLAFIEAKRHDLYADRFPDVAALEAYLGQTTSIFLQLAAMIIAPQLASGASEAAGYGGVSFGLARGLALHGDRFIPSGLNKDEAMAHGRKRLVQAQAAINALPKQLFPVMLPVALSDLYFSQGRTPPQWRRQWRLYWAARREQV